ncbi:hypothetical protein SAY86_006628 [Trapa natans]|uniref:Uncharacterized protein n=1 Tax=Trapa natans TaxID=22666 RepID=A0AAN7L662_TRANT|nr:hypothetical protein SAY86_006628 [Trapa natans]
MTDQMRSSCATRAACKRAYTATVVDDDAPATKKRVVLGELTNLSYCTFVPPVKPSEVRKPLNTEAKRNVKKVDNKARIRSKSESTPSNKEEDDAGIDVRADEGDDPCIEVRSEVDDHQMCREYVTDIYEYLKKMEVNVTFNYPLLVHVFLLI